MFAALERPRLWVHFQEVCQRIGEALRRQAATQGKHREWLVVNTYLVGGLEHEWMIFPYIGNYMEKGEELTNSNFSEGVGIPPTSYNVVKTMTNHPPYHHK